jgi:tRNA-specific 2-thiouridylase
MCNREVKFGVFWNFAKACGADYIATGHYAQNIKSKLLKSPDESKDQSYFLWTLTHDDLAHTLFPVGHLQKSGVRKLARKYNLPTATKKDSQGVCFLGPLDMKDFLKHYIESEQGEVLNEKGEVIGQHDGAVFFTLGERHGFNITKNSTDDTPLYVIDKNIENNTITVSIKQQGVKSESSLYELTQINWISNTPMKNKDYTAQIRYHGEQLNCKIVDSTIVLENPVLVSPGQSIVVYDKDVCIGGGIVK